MNTLTKNGKKRKGKATITATRLRFRTMTWEVLRARLLTHIAFAPKGEAKRIATALGTSPSQIHRWTCPVCEHDQEPSFSMGVALLAYLRREGITCNVAITIHRSK